MDLRLKILYSEQCFHNPAPDVPEFHPEGESPMRISRLSALAVLTAIFLVACGDDVTKTTCVTNEISGLEVVASADSLGKCTEERSGEMKFASKENAVYVCADSAWQNVSVAGKDGLDGKDGTSCTVEILADSSGYKVVCGGDSVGVIFNGEKGEAGKDGKTCSFTDKGNGTILQICGKDSVVLYKALCGNKPFDPAKSFCVADSVVSLCGGKVYDLSENFCFDDSVYSFCGGMHYAPDSFFCYNESQVELCGEKSYNPDENFCFDGSAYALCSGNKFNPTENVCHNERLYGFFKDLRDDQVYRTIQIGNQTWMAENLNYAYMPDTLSFCCNDSVGNCEKRYGRLYHWSAAMDSAAIFSENGKGCGNVESCLPTYPIRGICPDGWHLPDTTEWNTLFDFVREQIGSRDSTLLAEALKSTTGWRISKGSDIFGFESFPTADAVYTGYWIPRMTSNNGYIRIAQIGKTAILDFDIKSHLNPIRCIKD